MKTVELDAMQYSRIDALITDLSIRNWQKAEAELGDDESWDDLLAKLGSLLEWLAGSKVHVSSHSANAMGIRVWCLLYAVRPDLIRHETTCVAAERFSVSNQRIFNILNDLKAKTDIRYESRSGRRSPESVRRSIDAILSERAARKLARLAVRRRYS